MSAGYARAMSANVSSFRASVPLGSRGHGMPFRTRKAAKRSDENRIGPRDGWVPAIVPIPTISAARRRMSGWCRGFAGSTGFRSSSQSRPA